MKSGFFTTVFLTNYTYVIYLKKNIRFKVLDLSYAKKLQKKYKSR